VNICHVITRLIVGGAQENTVLTCRGLVERGHRVTLIAGPETGAEGSLWDAARASGSDAVVLHSLRRAAHPWFDVAARRALVRMFREIGPDVVHTHSSKAGILGRAAAAAAGVPVVIHTIHGMSFNRTQARAVQWCYRGLERWAAKRTTAFVTVADAMIDQAVAARLGPREKFVTVRSGIETQRFTPSAESRIRHRRAWGFGETDVVVGTIARLFVNKGYEAIIPAMREAAAKEPRLRFVWVGDGDDRERYTRRLEQLGLRDRVHLTGLVPPAKVPSLINGFDLMLHASAWEGLPRALVQGMLMQVPAVSFDNDGAPEVVRPGETGILVPCGDIKRLADAVVELAGAAERRRVMGAAGRVRCLKLFDVATMVTELEALYRRCLP
jgi:glycosyltransferase involved in cell wall biosynthesis